MVTTEKKPYRSGFCLTRNHALCKGEFRNGANAPKPIIHCACECHGGAS